MIVGAVLFAHLGLERIAHAHAVGGRRALKLHVVQLNLASDGDRTRRIVRLLLSVAAVGLSHDVAALKGGGHRQGVTGLTLDRRVARARVVRGALIPLPRDMRIGGNVGGARLGGRRNRGTNLDFARSRAHSHARDIN